MVALPFRHFEVNDYDALRSQRDEPERKCGSRKEAQAHEFVPAQGIEMSFPMASIIRCS